MIDQKKNDARMMLRAIQHSLAAGCPQSSVQFAFHETLEWRRFVSSRSTAPN
jgi:hypothetical protein